MRGEIRFYRPGERPCGRVRRGPNGDGSSGDTGKGLREASGIRLRSTQHGQKPITEARKLRVMRIQADPGGEQENRKVP